MPELLQLPLKWCAICTITGTHHTHTHSRTMVSRLHKRCGRRVSRRLPKSPRRNNRQSLLGSPRFWAPESLNPGTNDECSFHSPRAKCPRVFSHFCRAQCVESCIICRHSNNSNHSIYVIYRIVFMCNSQTRTAISRFTAIYNNVVSESCQVAVSQLLSVGSAIHCELTVKFFSTIVAFYIILSSSKSIHLAISIGSFTLRRNLCHHTTELSSPQFLFFAIWSVCSGQLGAAIPELIYQHINACSVFAPQIQPGHEPNGPNTESCCNMLQQLMQRYGHHNPRVHVIRSSSGSDRQLGLTFFQQHSTWQTELYPAGPLEISAGSLRPQSSSSGSWKKGCFPIRFQWVKRRAAEKSKLSVKTHHNGVLNCWVAWVFDSLRVELSWYLTHSHLYYTLTVALLKAVDLQLGLPDISPA